MNAMPPQQQAQPAQLPVKPQPPHLLQDAIALLKSDFKRTFAVDIETDSTIEPDESMEKQARVELLAATTPFLKEAIPASQAVPALGAALGEMLLFAVRGFKVGRTLESTFEQMIDDLRNAPPQPQANPEAEKAKAQMEIEKAKLQMDGERMKMDAQAKQQQMQADIQALQTKTQAEIQINQQRAEADIMLAREKAQADMALKQQVAAGDLEVKRAQADKTNVPAVNFQMPDEMMSQAAQTMAMAAKEMARPRVTRMQRGDGSVMEARSEVV